MLRVYLEIIYTPKMFVELTCEWMDFNPWLISQPNLTPKLYTLFFLVSTWICSKDLMWLSFTRAGPFESYRCVVTVFWWLKLQTSLHSDPGDLSSLSLSTRQPLSQFPPPLKSHFGSHFCAFAYNSHLLLLEPFPFLPFLSISPSQCNSNPISFLKTSPCSSTHIDIFLSELLLYL